MTTTTEEQRAEFEADYRKRHNIPDWFSSNQLEIAKRYQAELGGWMAYARRSPPPAAEGVDDVAHHILEALSWHAGERDDLTLEEAVEAFRHGYKKVRQRSDRAMLAQIIELLANAPAITKAGKKGEEK